MSRHTSVLAQEVIEKLDLRQGDNVIDCTVGDGGHSGKILAKTAPDGKLLAIDADPGSLSRAKEFLEEYQDRIIFVQDNFKNLKQIVNQEDFEDIAGVLMDLGWSSTQLKSSRGFSFQTDERLDMRYSPGGKTAADLLNNLSKRKLAFIFRRFGEEKYSRQIAEKIVEQRKKEPIKTTSRLVDIILEVYRDQLGSDKEVPWVGGKHPARKVFQALRISTNKELEALRKTLPQALEVLNTGGRIVVISFHSLEDRIVKHFFKDNRNKLNIITDSPLTPTQEEIETNPRSRSAKLRAAEKIN